MQTTLDAAGHITVTHRFFSLAQKHASIELNAEAEDELTTRNLIVLAAEQCECRCS